MKWKDDSESLTIYLSGEIDHCAAKKLREDIEKLIQRSKAEMMILDFRDVSFMDSSGVGMLIGRYKTMSAKGRKMVACCLSEPVDRLYRMAGLHRIIPVVSDEGRKEA